MESIQTKTRLKRKRVSKKNKKSWRKHSNIKDIEDFLEDQRLQERTGGIIAEKEDDSLFFVDSVIKTETKALKTKKDKYFFRNRPLKCHSHLLSNPNIPTAPKAKPRVDNPNRYDHLPRVKKDIEDRRNGIIPVKEAEKWAVASAQRHLKKRKMTIEDKMCNKMPPVYNIWETGVKEDLSTKMQSAGHFFLVSTKRIRNKVPKTLMPTKVPSVEMADPGASYNPSFEDHQKLLQMVYEKELLHLGKEKTLANWNKGVIKLPAHKLEENYLKEMSAGLFETETEKEEKNDITGGGKMEPGKNDKEENKPAKSATEDAPLPVPPTTSEVRKTRQQKRRQRERKSDEKHRAMAKAERVRLNDVYRLRSLRRQITLDEKLQARRRKRLAKKKAQIAAQTKKLGRYRFEESPVVFKLTSELSGSLRHLKPEGCMITDRYKSIQKRNLIETTVWKRGTKPSLKQYEKRGHKAIVA